MLLFSARGSLQTAVGEFASVSKSSIGRVICDVAHALVELGWQFDDPPKVGFKSAKQEFYDTAGFSWFCGCHGLYPYYS